MKKLILLSTFFFSISVHALPDCPSDTASSTWNNCYGTATWSDGATYVGEWKGGIWHGQGTATWSDGATYVGEWKGGIWHGQGTYTYWNGGYKYVGEHKDGKRHGQGTLIFANAERLVGYFMNDEYIPDICEDMGFVKGTESFGNCVLKLIDDL